MQALLNKLQYRIDDLHWDYDRLSDCGRETLDVMDKLIKQIKKMHNRHIVEKG